jgi:drug/metabolite transporter (DMT)-like permease
MLGNSISPGEMTGNLVAFIMPISFAILILIVRKFPEVDMIPLQLVAGIFAMLIGLLLSPTIIVSSKDIFLGFLAGFFQVGFGFIFITIGARSTPSAFVGIIMLTEAVLGPFWAWMFANENPPLSVLIGGSIVITAVVLQFLNKFIGKKQTL